MNIKVLTAIVLFATAVSLQSQAPPHQPISMVHDWTHHHVIFSETAAPEIRNAVLADPRFWHQVYRRHLNRAVVPDRAHKNPKPDSASERDWSFALGNGSGGTIAAPAKFVFDVTAAPSCTADFVVMGVSIAGSGTQANIIGLNNLYVNTGGTGLCSGTAPKVMFAYNVGPGTINSLVALSLDGKKVAFNENNGATSYFHVLTFSTAAGNGTSATAPAVPGTGNSAVDTKIALTGGVSTAPFVDYAHDVAYVTTLDNVMHKFSGVFTGTPAEVKTGGWPVTTGIANGSLISTPVYDSVSRRIFFTDSQYSSLDYVDDSGATATVKTDAFVFAAAGITPAPVVIDSAAQKVYAFEGNRGGTHAVVAQADTALTTNQVIVDVGTNNILHYSPLEGDFDNAYYSGSTAGHLYVIGNDSSGAQLPSLFNIGFGAGFKMNATTANGPLALATANADGSPIIEFYNSTLKKDYIFFGVTTNCSTTVTSGCIRAVDITTAFPTAATINNVILAATGGTTAITVDNDSGSAEASSVYYGTLTGRTLVKATQSALK